MTTTHEPSAHADEIPTIEQTEQEAAEHEHESRNGNEAPKKPISLRLPVADLELAKELAAELNIGYQTLLGQLIHDGLKGRQEDVKFQKLVAQIRASLPEFKAAQELANSPAVKAAQDLLNSPAVKAAQDLVSSPAIKATQEFANSSTVQKVKEFSSTTAIKAAQELANSPVAKMFGELTQTPAFKSVSDFASTTGAKIAREWENSAGGRIAGAIAKTAAESTHEVREKIEANEQIKELSKTVAEIRDALKKANLME